MISIAIGIIAGILASAVYGFSIGIAVVIGLAAFIAIRLIPLIIGLTMFTILAIGTAIAATFDFFLDKKPKRKLK